MLARRLNITLELCWPGPGWLLAGRPDYYRLKQLLLRRSRYSAVRLSAEQEDSFVTKQQVNRDQATTNQVWQSPRNNVKNQRRRHDKTKCL